MIYRAPKPFYRKHDHLGLVTMWRILIARRDIRRNYLTKDLCNPAQGWGHSSVGRALEWHSRGQGFDSPWLHFCGKAHKAAISPLPAQPTAGPHSPSLVHRAPSPPEAGWPARTSASTKWQEHHPALPQLRTLRQRRVQSTIRPAEPGNHRLYGIPPRSADS